MQNKGETIMKTFSEYQNQKLLNKDGKIWTGNFLDEQGLFIIRVKDSLLNDEIDENGNILPALQTTDGTHIEHWQNGVLHADNIPAVVDTLDNREEWWMHGRKYENPTVKL